MADKQAKEAASEICKPDIPVEPIFYKKETVTEIKKQMVIKWNRKYACSEKVSSIQDIFMKLERDIAMEKGTD